jgi:hypothetical protein
VAAAFGGYLRTLELDRAAMERHFAAIQDDIASGGFAGRFQAERNQAYPVVELIRQVISGDDPISHAEDRVRAALGGASAGANGHGSEPGGAPASPAASASPRGREAAGGVEPGPGGGRG